MKDGTVSGTRFFQRVMPISALLALSHLGAGCVSSEKAEWPVLAFENALAPRQPARVSPCQDFFTHVCQAPKPLKQSDHL